MGITQEDVRVSGHAIEARINAEDPAAGFLPSPGTVARLEPPLGPGVRLDTGLRSGGEIAREYDSMVAKLVVWAADRDTACRRLGLALDDLVVEGVPTTIPFHRIAVAHPDFVAARHATSSVEREWDLAALQATTSVPGAPDATRRHEERVTVEVDGRRFEVLVHTRTADGLAARRVRKGSERTGGASGEVLAPMQGTVIGYAVEVGARVEVGDPVVTLEAMKMENTLRATVAGTVSSTGTTPGTVVQPGALLAVITPD